MLHVIRVQETTRKVYSYLNTSIGYIEMPVLSVTDYLLTKNIYGSFEYMLCTDPNNTDIITIPQIISNLCLNRKTKHVCNSFGRTPRTPTGWNASLLNYISHDPTRITQI